MLFWGFCTQQIDPDDESLLDSAFANKAFGFAFSTCLFRYALSLAVQGLMIVSEGEIYICLVEFSVEE